MEQAKVKLLTDDQRQLLEDFAEKVAEFLPYADDEAAKEHEEFEKASPAWKEFPMLWNGYGPEQGGCFRDGGIFEDYEDVDKGIWRKFYCYFRFVADRIEDACGIKETEHHLSVYIDATYEDNTSSLVVCHKRMKEILFDSCKAWHFEWQTPTDLAEEMERAIKAGIEEYKRNRI